MTRGMCLAALAVAFTLAPLTQAQDEASNSNNASATATAVGEAAATTLDSEVSACVVAANAELAEAVGSVSVLDVALFQSANVQKALKAVGSAGTGGPPNQPAAGACGNAYGSDTTGCDSCCGRLWADYIRWCSGQANCQACQDQARAWRGQCEQGCVDVATWTNPALCSETYAGHADCFNCCVTSTNDMNRWCQLAYPDDAVQRHACEDDVMGWITSCLTSCPQ